ncbi:MAG: acyl-CoA dehydrogenase family protein [Proteobacteria bacterium]|nr:acyl-CoA dehydrogenase family protein [Pseudomonadota bacterium]
MNFEFTEEQNLLREQAGAFLADHCSTKVVRRILDGEDSYDQALWTKVVEMGWTATVIPEEYDGLGLSYLELSVIAEELGRALAPLPFSSSVYLATEALLAAGSKEQKEEWLPKLAAGSVIGCFALGEGRGQTTPKSLTTLADGKSVSGSKIPGADGDIVAAVEPLHRCANLAGRSGQVTVGEHHEPSARFLQPLADRSALSAIAGQLDGAQVCQLPAQPLQDARCGITGAVVHDQ